MSGEGRGGTVQAAEVFLFFEKYFIFYLSMRQSFRKRNGTNNFY